MMSGFGKKGIFKHPEYTKNGLFRHYLKGLLVILFIPFTIFYIILMLFGLRSVQESFNYSSTEILSRSVSALDTLFEVAYQNYESITSDSNIQTFLLGDAFLRKSGREINLQSNQMFTQFSNICISLNYLDSIHVYSKANDYFLSNVNSGAAPYFYDAECYDIYKNCSFLTDTVLRRSEGKEILTLCYIVNKGYENEGAVFFNIDVGKLIPTLLGNGTPSGALILSGADGKIIMSSEKNPKYDVSALGDIAYGKYTISKDREYVYNSTQLYYEHFTLTYRVTKHTYFSTFYPFAANAVLYFIFTALALVLLALTGAFKMYRSLSNAFAYIETPGSDSGIYGEFLFLTENMISQVEGNNRAEATLADKITKLKKYQTLALQTQINPHFLFNSLNLISSFALEQGGTDGPLVMIIDKLSDILRFCLNTKNYIIKIEEELDITRKYIEIENIKHDNSINFIFDIDDEIYKYYTLKMILQPIIENAISHGVKLLRREQGFVRISGKITKHNIIFSVSNNGPEIDPEKLADLRATLLSVDDIPENSHIGLRNVNQRIKLVFGSDYGCGIDSCGGVTTVTVTIPIITKSNDT